MVSSGAKPNRERTIPLLVDANQGRGAAEGSCGVPEAGGVDESGDIASRTSERDQGHVYPGTTIPPLAIDKAWASTAQHVPPGLPSYSRITDDIISSTLVRAKG